jgi:hypothetical protein
LTSAIYLQFLQELPQLRMFLWQWDTIWCSSMTAHVLTSTMQWWNI